MREAPHPRLVGGWFAVPVVIELAPSPFARPGRFKGLPLPRELAGRAVVPKSGHRGALLGPLVVGLSYG